MTDFSLIYLTTFPIRQNMTKVFSVQGHLTGWSNTLSTVDGGVRVDQHDLVVKAPGCGAAPQILRLFPGTGLQKDINKL